MANESVPAFTIATGFLCGENGKWSIWQTLKVISDPRAHAQSFKFKFYRQAAGDETAQLFYETNGTRVSGVLTVLTDGTAIFGPQDIFVAQPGKPLSPWECKLNGQEVIARGAWPDGLLVQEYRLNERAPVYFVPIVESRIVTEKAQLVTGKSGVDVFLPPEFFRVTQRIAWLDGDTLNTFDLNAKRTKSVRLRSSNQRLKDARLVGFDGTVACVGVEVFDVASGKSIARSRYGSMFALRNRIGYALGVKHGYLVLSAMDVSQDVYKPKRLKVLPTTDIKVYGRDKIDVSAANNYLRCASEDGIKLWDGRNWIEIPWLEKLPAEEPPPPPKPPLTPELAAVLSEKQRVLQPILDFCNKNGFQFEPIDFDEGGYGDFQYRIVKPAMERCGVDVHFYVCLKDKNDFARNLSPGFKLHTNGVVAYTAGMSYTTEDDARRGKAMQVYLKLERLLQAQFQKNDN